MASSLREGLILSRPNRFTMYVEFEGQAYKCYCPVSGRIGGLDLTGQSCLLSGPYAERKSLYTVEAVAVEPKSSPTFQWIGINQTKANAVVEQSLLAGELGEIAGSISELKREVTLKNHRIDFLLNDSHWLEVKMPLLKIYTPKAPTVHERLFSPGPPSPRLPSQLAALTEQIKAGRRASLLICFFYENKSAKTFHEWVEANVKSEPALLEAREAGLTQYVAIYAQDASGTKLRSLTRYP